MIKQLLDFSHGYGLSTDRLVLVFNACSTARKRQSKAFC